MMSTAIKLLVAVLALCAIARVNGCCHIPRFPSLDLKTGKIEKTRIVLNVDTNARDRVESWGEYRGERVRCLWNKNPRVLCTKEGLRPGEIYKFVVKAYDDFSIIWWNQASWRTASKFILGDGRQVDKSEDMVRAEWSLQAYSGVLCAAKAVDKRNNVVGQCSGQIPGSNDHVACNFRSLKRNSPYRIQIRCCSIENWLETCQTSKAGTYRTGFLDIETKEATPNSITFSIYTTAYEKIAAYNCKGGRINCLWSGKTSPKAYCEVDDLRPGQEFNVCIKGYEYVSNEWSYSKEAIAYTQPVVARLRLKSADTESMTIEAMVSSVLTPLCNGALNGRKTVQCKITPSKRFECHFSGLEADTSYTFYMKCCSKKNVEQSCRTSSHETYKTTEPETVVTTRIKHLLSSSVTVAWSINNDNILWCETKAYMYNGAEWGLYYTCPSIPTTGGTAGEECPLTGLNNTAEYAVLTKCCRQPYNERTCTLSNTIAFTPRSKNEVGVLSVTETRVVTFATVEGEGWTVEGTAYLMVGETVSNQSKMDCIVSADNICTAQGLIPYSDYKIGIIFKQSGFAVRYNYSEIRTTNKPFVEDFGDHITYPPKQ